MPTGRSCKSHCLFIIVYLSVNLISRVLLCVARAPKRASPATRRHRNETRTIQHRSSLVPLTFPEDLPYVLLAHFQIGRPLHTDRIGRVGGQRPREKAESPYRRGKRLRVTPADKRLLPTGRQHLPLGRVELTDKTDLHKTRLGLNDSLPRART